MTPTPPGELTLNNPRDAGRNRAVRYDIVTDAYAQLKLEVIDLPFDLIDLEVKSCGPSTNAPAAATADDDADLRGGHDIIMELC